MKIKMLTGLAGPRYSVSAGQVHECSDEEALRHIKAGHAVPLAEKASEKAVKKRPVETR